MSKFAFGSCGHQDQPLPVLGLAASYQPNAFIFLGDNIYGDTDSMKMLQRKYQELGNSPYYKKLKSSTRILAIWDDHDYGRNDAGRHYPYKKQAKEIFLDFFDEPANSERRKHDGIYHAEYFQFGDKTVQVILLDVRTFRDNLLKYDGRNPKPRENFFYDPDYSPHISKDSTLLGSLQWQWLEKELKKEADLRLVCSGSQFGIEYNGYEAWANFPHEQQRLLDLIRTTRANGVIFLTGDVHYAEISRLQTPDLYPIYDITASGITSTWDFATPNKNRLEGPVMENHFGLLSITWSKDPRINMEVIDHTNNKRIEYSIQLSELKTK